MRRLVVLATLIALALPAAAGGSQAALFLFSQTSAEPEDVILVRTVGKGVLLGAKRRGELRRHPLRVFMVSQAGAASVRSPRDRGLSLLGRLSVDRKGTGRLRFRTPNLPPGDYTTLIDCATCGPILVPSGPRSPFRIRPALRNCASSVYGELGPDWQRDSVQAGPLWLVGLRRYGPEEFQPTGGRSHAWVKVLLVVENGVKVTLTVPPESRSALRLSYDIGTSAWNTMRFAEARVAMTFEGCAPSEAPHTQFNGSFALAGPRCERLDVSVEGGATARYAIPFGRQC